MNTVFILTKTYSNYEESSVEITGVYSSIKKLMEIHPYLSNLGHGSDTTYSVTEFTTDGELVRELTPVLTWV